MDWRIVISGANLVTLLGLLFTALGSWNTIVTAIAKTDVVVQGLQRQVDKLDVATIAATRELGQLSKELSVLGAELKNIHTSLKSGREKAP